MLLSTQLEMEKMKVEQEKKKTIFVQESAREKVLDLVCPIILDVRNLNKCWKMGDNFDF